MTTPTFSETNRAVIEQFYDDVNNKKARQILEFFNRFPNFAADDVQANPRHGSALFLAVKTNNQLIVQILLENGYADPFVLNQVRAFDRKTPIDVAICHTKSLPLVQMLMRNGATLHMSFYNSVICQADDIALHLLNTQPFNKIIAAKSDIEFYVKQAVTQNNVPLLAALEDFLFKNAPPAQRSLWLSTYIMALANNMQPGQDQTRLVEKALQDGANTPAINFVKFINNFDVLKLLLTQSELNFNAWLQEHPNDDVDEHKFANAHQIITAQKLYENATKANIVGLLTDFYVTHWTEDETDPDEKYDDKTPGEIAVILARKSTNQAKNIELLDAFLNHPKIKTYRDDLANGSIVTRESGKTTILSMLETQKANEEKIIAEEKELAKNLKIAEQDDGAETQDAAKPENEAKTKEAKEEIDEIVSTVPRCLEFFTAEQLSRVLHAKLYVAFAKMILYLGTCTYGNLFHKIERANYSNGTNVSTLWYFFEMAQPQFLTAVDGKQSISNPEQVIENMQPFFHAFTVRRNDSMEDLVLLSNLIQLLHDYLAKLKNNPVNDARMLRNATQMLQVFDLFQEAMNYVGAAESEQDLSTEDRPAGVLAPLIYKRILDQARGGNRGLISEQRYLQLRESAHRVKLIQLGLAPYQVCIDVVGKQRAKVDYIGDAILEVVTAAYFVCKDLDYFAVDIETLCTCLQTYYATITK